VVGLLVSLTFRSSVFSFVGVLAGNLIGCMFGWLVDVFIAGTLPSVISR